MGKFLALVFVLVIAGGAVYLMTQNQKHTPRSAGGAATANSAVIDASADPNWLDQYKGKVVLVDFWATWCGPCKMAMPGVQKLHEKFQGRPVAILGVSCFEKGDAQAYMNEKGYTYGLVLHGDALAKQYAVNGIPTFVLLDPEGKKIMQSTGYDPSNEEKLGTAIESELKSRGL